MLTKPFYHLLMFQALIKINYLIKSLQLGKGNRGLNVLPAASPEIVQLARRSGEQLQFRNCEAWKGTRCSACRRMRQIGVSGSGFDLGPVTSRGTSETSQPRRASWRARPRTGRPKKYPPGWGSAIATSENVWNIGIDRVDRRSVIWTGFGAAAPEMENV